MIHYICKGGGKGVSEIPGTCSAEGCLKQSHHLEECNCEDNQHFGAFGNVVVEGEASAENTENGSPESSG